MGHEARQRETRHLARAVAEEINGGRLSPRADSYTPLGERVNRLEQFSAAVQKWTGEQSSTNVRHKGLIEEAGKLIGQNYKEHADMAETLLKYTTAVHEDLKAFRGMGFVARFKWLLAGRS